MIISIKLSKEERKLAESYAKSHALPIAEVFKQAFFEKIEDEFDIQIAESSYKEYVDNASKSTPVGEFWRELDGDL